MRAVAKVDRGRQARLRLPINGEARLDGASGYRPLYKQVYDVLVQRVVKGDWKAGESLPSEQALARELGVSQGTVRKVLDGLTAEKLLERRQGKGTFIAENTKERTLFRFFRIAYPGGRRTTPESYGERVKVRASKAVEQQKLDLARGEKVAEIVRTRSIDGAPVIRETIVAPIALFPGIDKLGVLPNTLYSLYQTAYGVNIVAAREEISADCANQEDVTVLGATLGDSVLCIDRTAISLEDKPVEWRRSRMVSRNLVYAVTLT
jgi:GntR family transcriptional regulator